MIFKVRLNILEFDSTEIRDRVVPGMAEKCYGQWDLGSSYNALFLLLLAVGTARRSHR